MNSLAIQLIFMKKQDKQYEIALIFLSSHPRAKISRGGFNAGHYSLLTGNNKQIPRYEVIKLNKAYDCIIFTDPNMARST